MPKDTVTTRIKTARPVTVSDLLNALKNSMGPIFSHFESVIAETGGSARLQIEVTVDDEKVKLSYGFAPVSSSDDPGMAAGADGPLPIAKEKP